MIIYSDSVYTKKEFLRSFFTGYVYDKDLDLRSILDTGTEEMRNCWDYSLTEIDYIVENNKLVVLVGEDEIFRFYEIPERFRCGIA